MSRLLGFVGFIVFFEFIELVNSIKAKSRKCAVSKPINPADPTNTMNPMNSTNTMNPMNSTNQDVSGSHNLSLSYLLKVACRYSKKRFHDFLSAAS